jgi:exopolyphosphatase
VSTTNNMNTFLSSSHTRLREVVHAAAAERPAIHLVIGNEAADPDSCVCAIAIAAALDASFGGVAGIRPIVAPLIQVPRSDFKLQLDRVHLLRRAGLVGQGNGPAWTPDHVTFADEVRVDALVSAEGSAAAGGDAPVHVHLVDHNKLSAALACLAPHVASIVDHHADEGLYGESVAASERRIELGIGSCASLVVERMRTLSPPLLNDPNICTLLLGAILLDTVNLDPGAKAQKEREAALASGLLETAAPLLGVPPTAQGRGDFFSELLKVKADLGLLLEFSVEDLLRQDYKQERLQPAAAAGEVGAAPLEVGVGSIVLPLPQLIARRSHESLRADFARFAASRGLSLLLLMSVDLEARQRWMLVYCEDPSIAGRVLKTLDAGDVRLSREAASEGAGECAEPPPADDVLQPYAVNNYKVSRKVLLPILRKM